MPKSAKINGQIFPRAHRQFVFSVENTGEEQKKKVLTSSDVLFSPENVGEERYKKVYTSSDVLFSLKDVGEEQKIGLHVIRCSVLP